jgi:hypothetical protein
MFGDQSSTSKEEIIRSKEDIIGKIQEANPKTLII